MKKNVITALCLLSLILPAAGCKEKSETDNANAIFYVTAESGLRVRQKPSLKGSTISILKYGEKVKVIEKSGINLESGGVKGQWVKVSFGKKTGWVFSGFLKEAGAGQKRGDRKALFKWEDPVCSYESTYDSSVYSENRIRGCYELVHSYRLASIEFDVLVKKQSDIEKLNTDELEKEYRSKTAEIQKLDLPEEKFWQELRKNTLKQLTERYDLMKAMVLGYRNPEYSGSYKKADPELKKYSDALISGDKSLFRIWREIVAKQAENNGSPESLWAEFNSKTASPEKLFHARNYVMTYGWYNRANSLLYRRGENSGEEEFLKLFISTKKISCEDI